MKKIAVPVSNEKLDSHFGHCNQFYIFDIENDKIVNEARLTPPPHEPGLLPKWLGEQAVTDIIAGGIGLRAIDLFKMNKINVYVGAPKNTPRDIIESHINGTLPLRANYCDH